MVEGGYAAIRVTVCSLFPHTLGSHWSFVVVASKAVAATWKSTLTQSDRIEVAGSS
jgi:hypothetical protein